MDEVSQIALGCRHKYESPRLTYKRIYIRTERKKHLLLLACYVYECTRNGGSSSNNVVRLVQVDIVAK